VETIHSLMMKDLIWARRKVYLLLSRCMEDNLYPLLYSNSLRLVR